jgi:hypothetical protein
MSLAASGNANGFMIEKIAYRNWQDAWRISNDTVELIVLADVGPRIVRYGFCGDDNVFFEVPADAGLMGGSDFRLYGGHRLWAWPEVARTYFPDNRPVSVSQAKDSLRFTSPIEDVAPGTHLQKQIEVTLDASGTRLRVSHSIANHGSDATQLAVWCPTMMRAGGRAILPLPPRAAMDPEHYQSVGPLTLWSFTDFTDSRWILGSEFIQLRQQRKSSGRFAEQMSGVFNPAGWGAYFSDGTLFVKRAVPVARGRYPDFGCNFEIFTNPEFLELETLSPIVELKPGASACHAETWALFRGIESGEDEAWIRSTVVPLAESVRPAYPAVS